LNIRSHNLKYCHLHIFLNSKCKNISGLIFSNSHFQDTQYEEFRKSEKDVGTSMLREAFRKRRFFLPKIINKENVEVKQGHQIGRLYNYVFQNDEKSVELDSHQKRLSTKKCSLISQLKNHLQIDTISQISKSNSSSGQRSIKSTV
jgi:hypothetical protein